MTSGPWSGVRVVELSGLTSAYATRMWAALGAEVVVVEPAGGHALRGLPPFAPGHEGPDVSLWWAFFGQGKRSVVAEPGSDDYTRLVASADVVISDVDPALGSPQPAHERQVVVAISPFGLSGPRRGWKGSELVAWASSGLAHTIGFPDRPPVSAATPVQFASHVTSLYALECRDARPAVRAPNRPGSSRRPLDAGMLPVVRAGDGRAAVPRRPCAPAAARQPARGDSTVGLVPER